MNICVLFFFNLYILFIYYLYTYIQQTRWKKLKSRSINSNLLSYIYYLTIDENLHIGIISETLLSSNSILILDIRLLKYLIKILVLL